MPDGRTDRKKTHGQTDGFRAFRQCHRLPPPPFSTPPPPPKKIINVRSTCTKSGNTLLSSISSLSIFIPGIFRLDSYMVLHLTCYFPFDRMNSANYWSQVATTSICSIYRFDRARLQSLGRIHLGLVNLSVETTRIGSTVVDLGRGLGTPPPPPTVYFFFFFCF